VFDNDSEGEGGVNLQRLLKSLPWLEMNIPFSATASSDSNSIETNICLNIMGCEWMWIPRPVRMNGCGFQGR